MRTQSEIRRLVSVSADMLKTMILSSHLFCFDRIKGQRIPRGVSVRYTLITLLGILKALEAGYKVSIDHHSIWKAALSEWGSAALTPADFGLYLLIDSQLTGENTPGMLQRLEDSVRVRGGWASCLGMDIGCATAGLAAAANRTGSSEAVKMLRDAVDAICSHYVSRSGLLYHFGRSSFRRRFPNFATQIYNVYGLSCASEVLGDDRPLSVAKTVSDKLLALQLPCGGWPWLYDTERGSVVERYEVYSVHQDGMAPMALLKLSELTGDAKYAKAAYFGLDWLYSNNELRFNMIDEEEGLIYRSIRRRKPFNRLMLSGNTCLSALGLISDSATGHFLEINPTCRPYHLGWLLFAWCGNEISFDG